MWTMNFQMFKPDLEKAEIKLPTSVGASKKQESARKKDGVFYFGMVLLLQYDLKNDLNTTPKNVQTTTQLHTSHMLAK